MPRPTQRSRTAQQPVRQARPNYNALAAALLKAMSHGDKVEVTLRGGAGRDKVSGLVTRWEIDPQIKVHVKGATAASNVIATIGGRRVRLDSISGAKWL